MKHFELYHRCSLDRLGQFGRKPSVKKLLGFLAFEGLNHEYYIISKGY
jgi:hypothetical protein